ncbi:MAG: hypothetical protein HYS13_03715 [Planctomycetia bacterium]|nr:hypothetical protein [Planctomycetia bacterium]
MRRTTLLWFLLAVVAVGIPGCGGCSGSGTKNPTQAAAEAQKKKEEEEKKKKEEEEKKKPDFELGVFATQPNDAQNVETAFKPGHWTSATVELWTNHFDFSGELYTDPFQLDNMPYRLGTSRPAILPKGQKKHLELVFFVPPGRRGQQIVTRLTPKGSYREVIQSGHPTNRMRDYQFHFVVLSANPDRYSFLAKDTKLDSIRPSDGSGELMPQYYRMSIPKIDNRVPLPSNSLTWTSTAYLLWDGITPSTLTEEQQQALVDWLHWGGQLIISGPDSLDTLQAKGGFLADYLPATAERDVKLAAADMAHFSKEWTYQGGQPLEVLDPWSGKKLVPSDHLTTRVLAATAAEGGDPLVVERLVGRGRIVVTAFRLAQKELAVNWRSFDGFLNGCLLRRPGRTFTYRVEDGIEWAIQVDWKEGGGRLDPRLVSAYRIFSRDAKASPREFRDDDVAVGNTPSEVTDDAPRSIYDSLLAFTQGPDEDRPESIGAGVAGWDPFNDASELARHSLRRAAGIRIPEASFIIWVLGVYVVVLVPVNWLVCWLFGRVEWAWIAAPVITIACAFSVVYLAQLDIGFARARTEVAVVELHEGYSRAHVTRYTALYTSLATTYDVKFGDPSGVAQPFPLFSRGDEKGQEIIRGQSSTTVHFRRDADDVLLSGFNVISNATGMLHSEQMQDVGGGLRLRRRAAGVEVVNDTKLRLQGAAVSGPQGVAWVGTLEPGASARLEFLTAGQLNHWKKHRDDEPMTGRLISPDHLNLRLLIKLAEDQKTFEKGETRLVAWTDALVEGMQIEPAASQVRAAAVVVAHLAHAPLGDVSHDSNARAMIEKKKDEPPAEGNTESKTAGEGP